MARLRYNGLSGTLGASLTNSATSVTFASKLTHVGGDVPTISGSDYIPLSILDANGKCAEVVHVTAYTTAGTTATIGRGKEGTSGVAHDNGRTFVNGPTVQDIAGETTLNLPITISYSSDGFNGLFTRLGEIRGAVTSAPWGFANPAYQAPYGSPGGPPSTLAGIGYSVVTSQSSTIDAYRGSWRATDQINTENGAVTAGGEVHTSNGSNEWWKVDFGSGYDCTPTRLGILGRATGGAHPRNFKLRGSNNNTDWTDLLTVTSAGPSDNAWWSAAVTGSAAYRYLQIYMTGNNSSSGLHLVLGDVEIWGTLDVA